MITVKDIFRHGEEHLNKEIELFGWVRKIRDQKKFGFIELNDGSFFKGVQIVFEEGLENFDEISRLSIASTIKVKGTLVKSEGSGQDLEVKAKEIEIFQKADLEYPLQNKRHTFEYLRTKAHLRARTNTFSAVFRVRSVLAYALHKFFQENNFVYVHAPIITGSDAEGAGEMFRITTLDLNKVPKKENGEVDFSKDFFGKSTNLTVSGQLNLETFCAAFRNVYTFGPTFRAEYSNTARHASEFWMVEPEIAFGDIFALMELAEAMVKYITIEILEKSGKKFEFPVKWGIDLQSEHERYLAEEYFKKPVFVTDYPKDIKAFYMKLNEDNKTVRAMDLLAPGIGEIIGGSQREDSYELLSKRMKELGLNEEDYEFYLDLRRFGSFPHSGYGLGFERMMMYLTGMQNIRDVIPFPRTPNNAEF